MVPHYFNPWSEVQQTQNRLPHWQQSGATYFVTWRLADSLPKALLTTHYQEREQWCRQHPPPWSEAIETDYHRRFSTRLDAWLDAGHGSCLLRCPQHAQRVADTLQHFEGQRTALVSFVVMPNHVHVIFVLHPQWQLEQIVHSWKRHSSLAIHRATGQNGVLWMKDYFDRLIRDPEHLSRCVRDVRRNAEKAQLKPSEFLLYESPLARTIL
jgi:putative transposase